jgi:hypothetical protein
VTTRWNAEVVDKLKAGARQTLLDAGVKDEDIVEFEARSACIDLHVAGSAWCMLHCLDVRIVAISFQGKDPGSRCVHAKKRSS